MGYIAPKLTTDTRPYDRVDESVTQSRKRMQKAAAIRMKAIEPDVRKDLAAPDNLPSLPFIWSNDPSAQRRARAYYFAVILPKVKSANGRYARTGRLEAAWELTHSDTDLGGEIVLSNPNPEADFVWGSRQVPSHTETGWQPLDDIEFKYGNLLFHGLIDDWFEVSAIP